MESQRAGKRILTFMMQAGVNRDAAVSIRDASMGRKIARAAPWLAATEHAGAGSHKTCRA